ncbi:MAG: hypothetical protein ACE5MG_05540 [Candidatus Methylomirabilales bacterium]
MRKSVAIRRKVRRGLEAGVSGFRRCVIVMLGVLGAVALSPFTALACSVCGGSAMGTDPGTGFNTSILFLLSMPFLVLGVIGGWLIYTFRRASSQQHRREEEEKDLTWRSRREMA